MNKKDDATHQTKINICMLHGYLLTDTGSNIFVSNLVRSFCQLGHDTYLLCQEKNPDQIPNRPFDAERCDSLEEFGWFSFSHGPILSLYTTSSKLDKVSGRKKRSIRRGTEERDQWLDRPSPVCNFVKKFTKFNSGPESFVPAALSMLPIETPHISASIFIVIFNCSPCSMINSVDIASHWLLFSCAYTDI